METSKTIKYIATITTYIFAENDHQARDLADSQIKLLNSLDPSNEASIESIGKVVYEPKLIEI